MTEPNEQQIALMRKYKFNYKRNYSLNPDNWMVLEETETELIILNKRKCRRMVLKKEGVT